MTEKEFSQRLARLRTLKGVSARDMSLSIGQSENYINMIENNNSMPSMAAFFNICEYLGIEPSDFFDTVIEHPALQKKIIGSLAQMDEDDLKLICALSERIVNRGKSEGR